MTPRWDCCSTAAPLGHHWGTYSQWGIVESWTLCSEDEPWCARHLEDDGENTRRYAALKETFHPVRFDPDAWADAARAAGLRDVVFTTKHHDGFCMWDTAQTDYKVTDPDCAYSLQPEPDITARVFDAFRRRGFLIGAYFSKPDGHSNDYWWRRFATPDRNVNDLLERYPERWQRFKGFVHVLDEPLLEPWESCVTMAQQWSYKPDDVYKPTRELVHLVVGVVAKGGNLLLGIGPDPLGELPPQALSRLAELGDWIAVNSVAIHGSRPIAPYKDGAVAFTRGPAVPSRLDAGLRRCVLSGPCGLALA